MLFWENEDAQRGEVHHLAVLAYHLQHPRLYSPDGLAYALQLLSDFVERGVSTQEIRRQKSSEVASTTRFWKVRSSPGAFGAYSHPIAWRFTAQDVVLAGPDQYIESVRSWAQAILDDLRSSGNLT